MYVLPAGDRLRDAITSVQRASGFPGYSGHDRSGHGVQSLTSAETGGVAVDVRVGVGGPAAAAVSAGHALTMCGAGSSLATWQYDRGHLRYIGVPSPSPVSERQSAPLRVAQAVATPRPTYLLIFLR